MDICVPTRCARTVAKLAHPALAKQPGHSLLLMAFELAPDAFHGIGQALVLTP
jgi:hypothetical protein